MTRAKRKAIAKLFSFVSLLIGAPAFAQSVQQSGAVTSGHIPYWVRSGVQADGGSSADSPITSIGVTNNGGAGFCVSSARNTAPGRNQLCFGAATNSAATISLQNYGTAPAENIVFNINGALQGFPTVSPLPVTVNDFACFSTTGGALKDCGTTSGGSTGQVLTGVTSAAPVWSSTPVLGFAGSTVGTLGFQNASSGTLIVSPPTGVLGTVTNTLQAASDTFVYRATIDTLTNKTLTSPTINAGALSGTFSGNASFSGNNTFTGQAILTGTSAPASAAGNTVVMGTITSPTLTNTAQAFLYNTAANGAILQGDGSSNDLLLLNKNSSVICSAATGGTNLICGSLSASSSVTSGVSGSSAGSLVFNNATSGSITLQPPTGALGSPVLTLPTVTGTVAVQAPAWTVYNPTITATSGTFTTVSATGSYFVNGKSVQFTVTITETSVGTASGKMVLPLPTGTAVRPFTGVCAESASIGKLASYFVAASGSNGNITAYDNSTTFIGNGFSVTCSGTYEQS